MGGALSAVIPNVGPVRQLDGRAQPDEQVTEEQAKDPARIARLLMTILRDVATLKRRFWPRRVDHEDRSVDGSGTTLYRFPHNFGGRVRWWPVDWSGAASGPLLVRYDDSDDGTNNDTLVLVSYEAGTLTLRIEEAG